MYLSNPTPTLLPQTLAWGSFKANDNQMPTLIFSNTLKLNFTGLTENTAYNWTIKVQKGLPNASALDSNNFTTGAGETTKSLNIYLTAGVYNVGNTYFFGLAQAVTGGEEGIQFDFKIDNRITLDTGGSTITGQLLNQAFSYSGQSFDVLTNRFLDELSLQKTNITAFTNAKIPTTLALQTYVTSAISGKENTANKGVANGYASLDSDGKVPNSQIPLLAIKNVFPVSSQAQMLALTAQVGDMAIRSDLNKAFILKEEPASTLANWLEILTPVDQVLSVNGQTGVVVITKSDIGLSNVDNTSDSTKNSAIATLTNKTIVIQDINLQIQDDADPTRQARFNAGSISASTTRTLSLPNVSDTMVARSSTDTLTNKTIDLTNNTLSGTTAQFNTALSDGDFATLGGTETLTNKTLTDPVLNAGSVRCLILVSMVQTSLGSNYNATAGTGEEEVTGLRITLPILASGTYQLKITLKGYLGTVTGNNTIKIRFGTSTTYLSNTLIDNGYVGGAKTLESYISTVIVTANLSVQNYVVIGFANDVNRSGASFSASGVRTNVLVEIFK